MDKIRNRSNNKRRSRGGFDMIFITKEVILFVILSFLIGLGLGFLVGYLI